MRNPLLLLAACLIVLLSSTYVQGKKGSLLLPEHPIRCAIYCPYGNDPNKACGCLPGPGPIEDPCFWKKCGPGLRCIQRGGIARCMPGPIWPLPRPYPGLGGVCRLPKVVGRCRDVLRRFYYNKSSGRCEQFIYGGCGSNQNNFRSLSECEERCGGGPIYPWFGPYRKNID